MVGPCKTLFMDEISTGLDSSTTHQIVRCLKHMVHLRKVPHSHGLSWLAPLQAHAQEAASQPAALRAMFLPE